MEYFNFKGRMNLKGLLSTSIIDNRRRKAPGIGNHSTSHFYSASNSICKDSFKITELVIYTLKWHYAVELKVPVLATQTNVN